MSSLDDWCDERVKCWASEITLKYPAGEMTVEFRTYVIAHKYGINAVKRLLKLSNAENRAVMLQTLNVLVDDAKVEYKKVIDDAEMQLEAINNKYLFEYKRKKAKQPIRKRRDTNRKALINIYKKLLKLIELIQEVE